MRCWPKASRQDEIDAGITLYEPVGCDDCNDGYKGRIGIYQVMPMSRGHPAASSWRAATPCRSPRPRRPPASATCASRPWSRSKQGVTSLAEINRVTKD